VNWDEFPGLAQVAICLVALLCAGLAAVSFALSYDAVYHLVLAHGHYSPRASKIYPLIMDGGMLAAELTAITMASLQPYMRRNAKRWPFTAIAIMAISGTCSIWMNLLRAGDDKIGMLIDGLPPVLMILSFQMLVVIVRRGSEAMGVELFEIPAVREAGRTVRGKLRRTQNPGLSSGSVPRLEVTSNGHGSSVREQVEAHLATLTTEQLRDTSEGEVYAALRADGVTVSKPYVGRVLGEWRAVRPDKRPAKS
jgi:hypothetical protein